MKTKLSILGSIMVLFFAAQGARAFVLFQDNFTYPGQPGEIDIVSGGVWVPGGSNILTADISISGNNAQIAGTSTPDLPRAYFTNGLTYFSNSVPNFSATNVAYFASNSTVAALYASFAINIAAPGAIVTNAYFAYFTDTNFDFYCGMYVVTNGATAGFFRVAVANAATPSVATDIVQQDLSYGTTYTIVARYVLSTGISTIWVNPANEAASGPTNTATSLAAPQIGGVGTNANTSACGFGLANQLGVGLMTFGSLVIGTTFADVVPASSGQNPPFIAVQPQDASVFAGTNVSFTLLAGGDSPLGYQWQFGGSNLMDNANVIGSTNATLMLLNLTTNQTGGYTAIVTNLAGTNTTRTAQLTVSPQPVPAFITNQPADSTNSVGDTVTFTVGAGGTPAPTYQWFFNNGVITNQTNASLVLLAVTTNQAGPYFVTVSNQFGSTNSRMAMLTVNPPPLMNIAQLRATLDSTNYNTNGAPTLYTTEGVVTTIENMTASNSTEFYIQDATAGIAVFWSGAPGINNLPPVGSLIQVTAPLSESNGLLELAPNLSNPLTSLTMISNNVPLPAPQILPFDPNITTNPEIMVRALQGSYFVASNVFLTYDAVNNFVFSPVNEPLTNANSLVYSLSVYSTATSNYTSVPVTNHSGQTFTLFVNPYTDLNETPKPAGPVTIYGILGQFVTNTPYTSGYQFTPRQLADVVPAAQGSTAFVVFQDSFTYPDQPGPIGAASGGVWVPGAGSTLTPDISINGNAVQIPGTSPSDLPRAYFTNGLAYFSNSVPNFSATNVAYFASNSPVAALYASFTINIATPGALVTNAYFAYFTDTNFDFRCRMFVVTNGAAAGFFRVAVANAATPSVATNIVLQDLSYGTTYTLVARYVLGSGISTIWVNPANEAASGSANTATALAAPQLGGVGPGANTSTCGFGLRNHIGGGSLTLGNLVIGTTFADVIPGSAGQNPPFIAIQPKDASVFAGTNVSFTLLAAGDPPFGYQWTFGGSNLTDNANVFGSTNATLILLNLTTNQTGGYAAIVTNLAGTNTTRTAQLTVSPQPVPAFITSQPADATNSVGDTVTFNVGAGGVPAPTYQWFFNNGILSNQTSPSLMLASVTTNQAGPYFVAVSNQFGSTNSRVATLTVNPPPLVNIAQLRATLDSTNYNTNGAPTLYTTRGVVTTIQDMTTSGNSEFYIQDTTAGIAVFWSGAAAAANLPPAGSLVQVIGPLSDFDGLLELEPVLSNALHSVTVISNNVPLPAPQILPFDPNILTNPAIMVGSLQGSYFVASNVFLTYDPVANFVFSATDEPITNANNLVYSLSVYNAATSNYTLVPVTNANGQTFTLFVNSHTDLDGTPKPAGPVTIYGVLGQFKANTPYTSGYEFTPRQVGDVVPAVSFTNVLSNLVRLGDRNSNAFTETVLRPGESLTMNVLAVDPAGGPVNIATTDTPPAGAAWNLGPSGGTSATGSLTFMADPTEAGSNYVFSLVTTLNSGPLTNLWSIYVPNTIEQLIYLSEILTTPTTNVNSPAFNPLKRAADTNSIAINDQYIELANVSSSNQDLLNWDIGNGLIPLHQFANGGAAEGGIEDLPPGGSFVVYGGPLNGNLPNLPVTTEPASTAPSSLTSLSGGVITLHNGNGFLVDRVVYPAGTVIGSFSRFATLNDGLVRQAYINTNLVTPGLQYDGGSWSAPTKVPAGVSNILAKAGNPLVLSFTANTNLASTLWQGNSLSNTFSVIFGQQFTNSAAAFFITNPTTPQQFYYITTQ